jgi:hypothetical protein
MTRNVQRFLTTMSAGVLFFAGASAAVAATHPAIGTWHLNLAKSTDESTDAPPKSETFIFTDSANGVSLTTRIVGTDGKSTVTKGNPVKWDGTAHPETSDPDHDSITVKPVGAQTIEWAMTKKGAPVRSGTLTVSRDGKMMTISGASVAANGGKTYFNDIFDRK